VRSLVFPWLTFPSVFPSLSSLVLPGLFDSLSWLFAACLSDPAWFTGNPRCLPPALTHCSASDFDSALSTLPSIPLLDICLFDLLFVLIKLHVDLLSPLTSHSLHQGCSNLVLEGRCPAGFSTNLPQHTCMEASSMPSKSLISCFRCVLLGLELNSAGHQPSRTEFGQPWSKAFGNSYVKCYILNIVYIYFFNLQAFWQW